MLDSNRLTTHSETTYSQLVRELFSTWRKKKKRKIWEWM